jgi:chemotaxis protein methyltransferase CheR
MENHSDEVGALEVRLLLEAIHAKYGYDLRDYAPDSIQRRVLGALARSGLRNLGEFQHQVLVDQDFFAQVLEQLLVRVSSMFRDPGFFGTFRARVVPILRTYPLLKIWHSGCAAGEEVYTSAIVLSEEGLYGRSHIYATDLSTQALEQAKQGIYSAQHLEASADSYLKSGGSSNLSSYYTAAYNRIAIKESLRQNISFFQHDLVSDYVFGEMQVIFCRNVLIYFTHNLRDRVLEKFAQSLCPGGFLCLGSSERLRRSRQEGMFAEFAAEERIYRYLP